MKEGRKKHVKMIYVRNVVYRMVTDNRSGGCSRKRVQQTLSLTLTSELTYSEMGYSEYSLVSVT